MYELLGFRQDHDIKKKVTGLYSDKAFFHGLGISTSRKDKETITDYVLGITKIFSTVLKRYRSTSEENNENQ